MSQVSVSSMKHHCFFLFAFFLLLSSAVATDFDFCPERPYDVKVEEVVVVPDPVVPGKPATFNISASTDDSISGGKVMFTVFYNGMPIDGDTRDLCKEVSCPIAGNFLLSYTLSLAGFFPPGSSYALRVIIMGDKQNLLTCSVFDFKVGFGYLVFDD